MLELYLVQISDDEADYLNSTHRGHQQVCLNRGLNILIVLLYRKVKTISLKFLSIKLADKMEFSFLKGTSVPTAGEPPVYKYQQLSTCFTFLYKPGEFSN